jgi:hypothetical protein
MSYTVARRTIDVGIRAAFGANRQDVIGIVMRDST